MNWVQRITRIRDQLNWSREQLAAVLGCSYFTVSRWEQGLHVPDPRYQADLEVLENEIKKIAESPDSESD